MKQATHLTIRISSDTKEALKKKAEEHGKTITDVLMDFIGDYLGTSETPKQASIEKRVTRLEKLVEEKLQESLGELVA